VSAQKTKVVQFDEFFMLKKMHIELRAVSIGNMVKM